LGFSSESLPTRTLPTTINTWASQEKLSFLRGLYSANGSVIKSGRVSLKTTCKDIADSVKLLLEEFEINSYITTNKSKSVKFSNGDYTCKESYDLNISRFASIKIFAEKIAFVHKYKNDNLQAVLVKLSPVVKTVIPIGQEEVFDFTLYDKTHWGIVGSGYVAHNCHEISLRPFTFCNLVEINGSDIENEEDYYNRCKKAAFISTLQASYTDFYYLRPIWRTNTEKDSLVGVGITGIASNKIADDWIKIGSNKVKEENERVAKILEINKAARTTTVKPSGTSSLVLGTSSGIHAWHSDRYIRTIRVGKDESIYTYLSIYHPELIEDEYFRPHSTSVISIPQQAPEGSILRTENVFDLLERVKKYNIKWVQNGHRRGPNFNNVSATVSIKPDEWEAVGQWMWENRNYYSGISVLPFSGGSYIQAPFTDCTDEEYNKRIQSLTEIDLTKVVELIDLTNLTGELACANGECEIK